MRRLALVLLVLLLAPPTPAEGTAQTAERIRIDGREHRLQSDPLRPWIEADPKRASLFEPPHSGNWRGYVATWAIADGWLELRSIVREVSQASGASLWTPVSLDKLFGDVGSPIRATWFTGTLRVARGSLLRIVSSRFDTFYEREILLTVVKGKVTSRRLFDNRTQGVTTSRADRAWVAKADKPAEDDTGWYDARTLETPSFKSRVPPGRTFRTRGVLWIDVEGESYLHVPPTPSTPSQLVSIASLPEKVPTSSRPHVEIRARWKTVVDDVVELEVLAIEELAPGQSMHHPAFHPGPWDEYEERGIPPTLQRDAIFDWSSPLPGDASQWDGYVDMLVSVDGRALVGPPSSLNGIEIAPTKDVAHDLVAVGELQKWVVTKRLLRSKTPAIEPFRARGPGVYWRLVDPLTGKLAVARRTQDD